MQKYCCEKCFADIFIVEIIQKDGVVGTCAYCDGKDVKCTPPADLREIFTPLADIYAISETIEFLESSSSFCEEHLWEAIQNRWRIFSDETCVETLLKEILIEDPAGDQDNVEKYYRKVSFLKLDLKSKCDERAIVEDTHIRLWQQFNDEIKKENRFFPSTVIDLDQLGNLFQAQEKKVGVAGNVKYYRARNSHGNKKYEANEMGKPPKDKAIIGRANPVGIPYLYMATNAETAISEIRPYINDFVTVGTFEIIDELNLVDLTLFSPLRFYRNEDFENSIDKIEYLETLGSDLAKPINPKDAELEYLPTQYLCEYIKSLGWDGVVYRSSLAKGDNIAIFNDLKLQCINTELYQIKSTRIEHIKLM